jgi:hypothetical protein
VKVLARFHAMKGNQDRLLSRFTRNVTGQNQPKEEIVTQAAMNGVSERDIIRQTGHKSAEMRAKYIRIGEMFTRNATTGLGIQSLRT